MPAREPHAPRGPGHRSTSPDAQPQHSPRSSVHQILEVLRQAPDSHVSGASLASRLGISRTSVWKHIQALRSKGYHIDTHPRRGYRLTAAPNLLLPEELLPRLHTRSLGRAYHHLAQTTSTNDQAMAMALRGAPHGTLVVAEEQTHGRGRLQRAWESSAHHGIYLSLLLRGPFSFERAPQVTMVSALTLTRLIRNDWGLESWTKWPNDVLIRGRKVAGILTEAKSDQDRVHFLVMGVGINVNHGAGDLGGPFRYPATSLAMELGHGLSRTEFLAAYLDSFEEDFTRWEREGFDSFSKEWESMSWILNRTITLKGAHAVLSGKVVGFSSEGALRLLQHDGGETLVWAGDVVHVEGIT
ncbi:MAG: biotin--[acetyl-CoA-carboxylase] ligase [Syntrophobacteraceae bacterium]|nr:biotin--[acetyl-CoA-carboxylase] ligase [Syntrophobacteraceae bacterium]